MAPDNPSSSISKPGASQTNERVHDAASLVITKVDDNDTVCVLMGRRHADAVFLPNKFVFPGGRFDSSDKDICPAYPLSSRNKRLLTRSINENVDREDMYALALTAIRETFEETGVVVGGPRTSPQQKVPSQWREFFDTGFCPDPSGLRFFARAITPPGRTRRYDTRFFHVAEDRVACQTEPTDHELGEIGWIAVEDAQNRDIASITHHILADLAQLTREPPGQSEQHPVPFYRFQNDAFERALLSHQDGTA